MTTSYLKKNLGYNSKKDYRGEKDEVVSEIKKIISLNSIIISLVISVVVGIIVLFILGPIVSVIAFVVITLILGHFISRYLLNLDLRVFSDSFTNSKALSDKERNEVLNIIEGLSVVAGREVPEFVVVGSDDINGFVVSNLKSNRIFVSKGAVSKLNRVELEGFVSLLMGRIRTGLSISNTYRAFIAGRYKFLPFKLKEKSADLIFEADLAGIGLTKYPPGVVGVIEKALENRDSKTFAQFDNILLFPYLGSKLSLDQRLQLIADL